MMKGQIPPSKSQKIRPYKFFLTKIEKIFKKVFSF